MEPPIAINRVTKFLIRTCTHHPVASTTKSTTNRIDPKADPQIPGHPPAPFLL